MKGDSDTETLQPVISVENFGEWFSGVLVTAPSAYERFASFLKEVMPDIESVKNPSVGRDSRSIFVSFDDRSKSIDLSFNFLSDGEKCFFISALLIASTKVSDPFVCFWDEPDNYFAPHEVSPVITSLRRAFRDPFQLLITSHNVDAIKRFSDENTFHLYRKSHIETPRAESVEELKQRFPTEENFLDRLVDGDVDL
jgi:predicted ATPase